MIDQCCMCNEIKSISFSLSVYMEIYEHYCEQCYIEYLEIKQRRIKRK